MNQDISQHFVVAGQVSEARDLSNVIVLAKLVCLNSDASTDPASVFKGDGLLKSDSDVDHQLLLNIPFSEEVKLQAIEIKAIDGKDCSGPKQIKLFVDKPNLDFAEAEDIPATQELDLKTEDLQGKRVALKFVKFQRVHSLAILISSNQGNTEVTFLNRISLFGSSIQGTDVKQLKKIDDES